MSTPLPALNAPRVPDHLDRSAPDTSVVPLLHRIREQAVVSGFDDEERTGRDDDGMEPAADDKPADSITVDGNLFLTIAQARRVPNGLSPPSAACSVGTVSTTTERGLSSIPPQQSEKQRGELPLRMPRGTAPGSVRDDTTRGRRADTARPVSVVTSGLPDALSPSPSPSSVADAPTQPSYGSARPQPLPDARPVSGQPPAQGIGAAPVPTPAALSSDVAATGAPPTVDHRLREPADARSAALPLTSLVDTLSTAREFTAAGHADPRTPISGSAFRSIAALKEQPAPPSLHRPVSVTVPFSSWGPGHQVTATWMQTVLPGTAPAAITLRGSSDAAQRAVDGALSARDGGVPGTVEIHRADDAHDDREKRGNVPRLPEDEE